MRARLSPLGLALLIAGCGIPRIETAGVAPVAPPDRWRTDVPSLGPVEHDWWQAFGDPTLTALVEQALASNLDIAVAGARLREAKAQELAAHAALLPTLDAGVGAQRSRSISAFGTPLVQTAAQPQAQVAWEADLFGRLADQQSAAHSAWLASAAARDAIRLAIASAVASGYVNLLTIDARLAVAHDTVTARSEELGLARRRAEYGYAPRLEQAQAQAQYEGAIAIIAPLEQARARQENAIKLLTGALPGPIAPRASLASLVEPAVPEGLPSELLRRRPDVAQAELLLAATDDNLSAARKRFLPQVRLSAAAGAGFSTLLQDPITIWSVGGSILAPLFQGGRLRAGAETAAAQRDAAAFAYRRTALTAFREVDDALVGVVRADEQVVVLTRQRDALADAYRYARNRFRAGYSPFLEQIDAQRLLLAVELALAQAKGDAFTARIALYQAMGGGWSRDTAGPT